MMKQFRLAAAAAFLAVPMVAEAHVGLHDTGLVSGLAHPLTGLDHLLAMLAVGLWAGRLGGIARIALPAAFLAMMGAGAALGLVAAPIGGLESWIAVSVAVLGLLVAFGIRLPLGLALPLVGAAALAHGQAHGAEMPAMADPLLFGLGFLLATAGLHGAGLAAGQVLTSRTGAFLVRSAGALVAVAGLGMLG